MKFAGLLLAVACMNAMAQDLGSLDQAPASNRQYVSYTAEPQVIQAGRHQILELHFRVLDGFHINSHTPRSELLIPTKLELQPAKGIRTEPFEYPAGKPYSFSFDPGNKLEVYADDFTVRVPVIAAAGPRELYGVLKYQACDKALCYPPRALPVSVSVSVTVPAK